MGESGPCGPCSEVYWDLWDHITEPDERFLELWNHLFMQLFATKVKASSGRFHVRLSILVRVLNVWHLFFKGSNYHTDVFVPLLHSEASVMEIHRSRTSCQSFTSALKEELDPQKKFFGIGKEI